MQVNITFYFDLLCPVKSDASGPVVLLGGMASTGFQPYAIRLGKPAYSMRVPASDISIKFLDSCADAAVGWVDNILKGWLGAQEDIEREW